MVRGRYHHGLTCRQAVANPTVTVTGIAAVPDGDGTVLYVGDADAAAVNDPIMRSVNPAASRASSRGAYFEPMGYAFTGFTGAAAGPWRTGGNTLWMLDTLANANSIWTYTDQLAAAPELKSPADGYNTGRTGTASLGWSALSTATRYEIWVSTDSGFSTFAGASPLFSTTTGVSVAGLLSGRTYYWKVCSRSNSVAANVGRNVGPWSATWSVTTGIAGAEWTPFAVPAGVAPSPGAADVSIRPAFQWNPADWATGYEFELSENPGLTARGYFVEVVTSAPETTRWAAPSGCATGTSITRPPTTGMSRQSALPRRVSGAPVSSLLKRHHRLQSQHHHRHHQLRSQQLRATSGR